MKPHITKKTKLAALLSSVLLTMLSSTASADTDSEVDLRNSAAGTYVKLYGGLNNTSDSDYRGSGDAQLLSGAADFDSGILTGLAVGYRFSESFAAELDYTYRSNDIKSLRRGASTLASDGDLASVAIMANAMYYADIDQTWRPYVGAGLGFLQEIDSDITFEDGSKIEELEDEVFAWQAMLGVEVPLSDAWRLFAEGRYLSAPSPTLANSTASYKVDYDNLGFLLGIGYQF